MFSSVVLGSAAVVTSILALWWGLTGSRQSHSTITLNGSGGHLTDMHAAVLERGIGERALQPMLARFGRRVRRITPQSRLEALEHLVHMSGVQGWTVERVLAMKVLLACLGGVLGSLQLAASVTGLKLIFAIVLVVVGFMAPDVILRRKAESRQAEIKRSLADTIDQLSITVQAGLGIDAAISRVTGAMGGPLGAELSRAVQDMRAGLPRVEALLSAAERSGVVELRQFVVALAQAEKLGVPIARTLAVQAAQMRLRRRQHAEEQAMKLPVKILFPMVVCILPCLFIVLLGPGAINMYDTLIKG